MIDSISVFKMLKQVGKSLRHYFENPFKEMNLTGPQGMLVMLLAKSGKRKVSELSEMLQLSNSTVSGIIDRLEKQEMVERIRSEEDRRVVYVDITAGARKSVDEHHERVKEKLESMMDKATPTELEEIFNGLKVLEEVIERQK
jgi:Transcriptional regulators